MGNPSGLETPGLASLELTEDLKTKSVVGMEGFRNNLKGNPHCSVWIQPVSLIGADRRSFLTYGYMFLFIYRWSLLLTVEIQFGPFTSG